jgi:hypothetical protein
MAFLDAAYEVLKQAGQPLHYVEIANGFPMPQTMETYLEDRAKCSG